MSTAPELSPAEAARVAAFDAAPVPPEVVVEAATGRSYLRLDDRTVWPNPTDPNEVQWRLRYGTPSKADLLIAASMMAAYRELVGQTYKRRSQVISRLRAALASPAPAPQGAEPAPVEDDEPDLATELVERGLRACCGQPSETHCR